MNRITIILLFCCHFLLPGCQPSEPESPLKQPEKKAAADIRETIAEKPLPQIDEASQLLDEAQIDFQNRLFASAREKIDLILIRFPDTDAAASARELLTMIESLSIKPEEPVKTEPKRFMPLKNMRTKTDPETGTIYYKDKNTPQYNDISSVYLYFGKKENEPPFLRFRIRHCGDAWLDIMSYLIMADHERFLQSIVTFKKLKGTNSFQELYDEPVTPELLVMIKRMIYARKTTIRLHGQKGIADVMITNAQRKSMKNVLDAFNKVK